VKIQVQHTFYLDFLLPRMDVPEPFMIHISLPDYDAYVMGWDKSELLFHGESGHTIRLAEFTISPVGRPGGSLTRRVRDHVMDRIQVVLEWDADSAPEVSEDFSYLWRERGVRWANEILDHMRVTAKSIRIRRIRQIWKPNQKRLDLCVPYTQAWFIKDTNTPIPMFTGVNTMSSTGAVMAPETGSLRWADLGASISRGDKPPLHLSLLIDAEDALTSLSLREAVLSIASACEIRGELFMEEQLKLSKAAARAITRPHNGLSFGERYFHLLPMAVCSRSFQQDSPDAFADIEACYAERNRLMHAAKFSDAFASLDITVQNSAAYKWVESTKDLLEWMDDLPLG
jgi:hypothetical protein